ncbi:MAG: hypothetical protein WD749_07580, partial [Phycisphaerales bacterium]
MRPARIIPALAAAVVLGLAVLAGLWAVLTRPDRLYTDGSTIRQPASAASPRDILWQPPTPHEALNTPAEEYEPRVSPDGRRMYFVRGRAGENADIYVRERTPEGWGEATPLAAINTERDELGPELSADGALLLFYSNRDDGRGGYDLWAASRDGDGWGEPFNLGESVNTPYNEYSPALTPDGAGLYFASNRPRPGEPPELSAAAWPATLRENQIGHDYDLYRSPVTGDPASPAYGPAESVLALNTEHNEGTPALSPVGDFLYFSSDRPGGEGGLDLYRVRRLGAGHGAVENLGAPVNSPWHDLDPAPSMGGFALDFSSSRPLPPPAPPAPESADATEAAPPLAAGDYNLFHTESREVYIEREARPFDWAGLWATLWPWLLWLLLLALLLFLLWLLREILLNRRLTTLAKCLLGSAIAHMIILFLLSLWGVTASLGELFKKPGGARVHLVSAEHGSDALVEQVRGELVTTEAEPARMAEFTPTISLPVEIAALDPQANVDRAEATPERLVERTPMEAPAAPPESPPQRTEPTLPPEVRAHMAIPEAPAPTAAAEPTTAAAAPTAPPLESAPSVTPALVQARDAAPAPAAPAISAAPAPAASLELSRAAEPQLPRPAAPPDLPAPQLATLQTPAPATPAPSPI